MSRVSDDRPRSGADADANVLAAYNASAVTRFPLVTLRRIAAQVPHRIIPAAAATRDHALIRN